MTKPSSVVGRPSSAGTTTIRPLQSADVPAVVGLEVGLFPDPWSAQMFREAIDQATTAAWVACVNDAVIAYAILRTMGDEAELMNIAIAASHQRQGIGARLVRTVVDHCRTLHVQTIYLEVRESNIAAHGLYQREGFAMVGRRAAYYTHEAEDALIFARRLSS